LQLHQKLDLDLDMRRGTRRYLVLDYVKHACMPHSRTILTRLPLRYARVVMCAGCDVTLPTRNGPDPVMVVLVWQHFALQHKRKLRGAFYLTGFLDHEKYIHPRVSLLLQFSVQEIVHDFLLISFQTEGCKRTGSHRAPHPRAFQSAGASRDEPLRAVPHCYLLVCVAIGTPPVPLPTLNNRLRLVKFFCELD